MWVVVGATGLSLRKSGGEGGKDQKQKKPLGSALPSYEEFQKDLIRPLGEETKRGGTTYRKKGERKR